MKKIAIILGMTGVIAVGWFLINRKIDLISPLGRNRTKLEESKVKVVGFLPTWMVGKTIEYKNELDRLIFLGVEMGGEGSLIWDVQSKKINNEDYLKLKNNISKNGGKNILGIKLFKDKEIDSFLASDEAKLKAIDEIRTIVNLAGYDGINLDFEYMNDPMRLMNSDFLEWLVELRRYGVGEMSMDVFANTIIKGDSEKIKQLINNLDYLVVMAYDFHTPGSNYAGPVAPISSDPGDRNLTEIVAKIGEVGVDQKKVIMALPLYGYEWQVEDMKAKSRVVGGGSMVSYRLAEDKYKESNWDDQAMSPWISRSEVITKTRNKRVLVNRRWKTIKEQYQETIYYEAYFENERSLGAKLDLVKGCGVGGVGFWALGYEGNDSNVWKIVGDKMER